MRARARVQMCAIVLIALSSRPSNQTREGGGLQSQGTTGLLPKAGTARPCLSRVFDAGNFEVAVTGEGNTAPRTLPINRDCGAAYWMSAMSR